MYIRYFVLNLNSLFWSSRILHHLDQPYPADLIPIMSHPNHKQEPLMPPVPESGSMDDWELSPHTEHFILYLTQSHRYSCLQPYRNSPWTMLPPPLPLRTIMLSVLYPNPSVSERLKSHLQQFSICTKNCCILMELRIRPTLVQNPVSQASPL